MIRGKLRFYENFTAAHIFNFRFQSTFTLNDQKIVVWSRKRSSVVHVMFCDNPKLKDFSWQDCALMTALSRCSGLRFRKIAHCGCGHFEIRDQLPSRCLCHKRTLLQVIQEVIRCGGYEASVEETVEKEDRYSKKGKQYRCVFVKKTT